MLLSFIRVIGGIQFSVLFLIINGVISASSENCNESDLKRCMEDLKVFTSNQDLAFAQTDEELTRTCRHLREAMGCVNAFTTRCFDNLQREVYNTLTAGAQGLLSDLCNPGSSFRADYLKHASCFKSLSPEYKQCAEDYLQEQEIMKKTDMAPENRLKQSCCLFDGYRHCTRTAVLQKCSAEAADTGEQIVTKAGGPLVKLHCADYKFNSPECSTGSLLTVPSTFILILMLIASRMR